VVVEADDLDPERRERTGVREDALKVSTSELECRFLPWVSLPESRADGLEVALGEDE
jgi:hypothetical protein